MSTSYELERNIFAQLPFPSRSEVWGYVSPHVSSLSAIFAFPSHLGPFACCLRHQVDWEQDGQWFLRIQSAGIPAHAYGEAHVTWSELVLDQSWDVAIPIISDEDEATIAQGAQRQEINSTECLIAAARGNRPLGIALNGVPFFSPFTEEGKI